MSNPTLQPAPLQPCPPDEKAGHVVIVLMPAVGGPVIVSEAIDMRAKKRIWKLMRAILPHSAEPRSEPTANSRRAREAAIGGS